MATTAPTPASAAKPSTPAPAAPVAPAAPDPAIEIAQLRARLAQLEPASENAPADSGPVDETINMGGLVLRKTVDMDGVCETEVLKKPMIDRELIRATRASQRESGF